MRSPEKIPVYYGSMSALSKAAGIPLDVLKAAKAEGCPAFRANHGVNLPEFLAWIFGARGPGRDDDTGDEKDWKKRYSRANALLKEIELEHARGESMPRSEARSLVINGTAVLFGELDRVLCQELPAALSGLTPIEIRTRIQTAIGVLKGNLRAKFAEVAEETPQTK